jgi:hypothetical protein
VEQYETPKVLASYMIEELVKQAAACVSYGGGAGVGGSGMGGLIGPGGGGGGMGGGGRR